MKFGFSFGSGAVDVVRPLLTIPDDVAKRLRTLVAINIVIVNDTTVDPALESPAEPPTAGGTTSDAPVVKRAKPGVKPETTKAAPGKSPKQGGSPSTTKARNGAVKKATGG